MQTTLMFSPSSIERFVKNSKLFSYISTNLTKTYCYANQDSLLIYFKGQKSLLSFRIQLEEVLENSFCFSVDVSKFLSGLKKMFTPNIPLKVSVTENSMTFYSNVTDDKITFSVNTFDTDTSEVSSLFTFFTEKEDLFTDDIMLNINQSLLDFCTITNAYMAIINKNNSIQISTDRLTYSDRTVVLTRYANIFTSNTLLSVNLHRFILGFLEFVTQDNATVQISNTGEFVQWTSSSDPQFKAFLAIDPCIINIPTQDEVDAISPEAGNRQLLSTTPSVLLNAIDFFSGLFEASVWKPITFNWTNLNSVQSIKLSYKHPLTEVEKDLTGIELEGTLDASQTTFTLISDSLKSILLRLNETGKVFIYFNDKEPGEAHGAGILLEYYDDTNTLQYSAVLAKLQE